MADRGCRPIPTFTCRVVFDDFDYVIRGAIAPDGLLLSLLSF